MKPRGKLAVSLVVGAITLAACSSATSTSATAKTGNTTVPTRSVSVVWQPAGESSFFYATKFDVWKRFGIKVEEIEAQSGPAMFADLASNAGDVGIMGTTPFIGAVAKGVDLLAVAENNNTSTMSGLYVNPKDGITSLKSLEGKSVAVTLGSSADVGLHKALTKAGVPWSSVNIENLAPAELLAAYEKGNVVGGWIWDTWGQKLLAAGAHLLTTETKAGLDQPNIYAFKASFVHAHPHTVERFIAALNYSAGKVNKDPSSIAGYFATTTGITVSEAMTILTHEPSLTISEYLSSSAPISLTNNSIGLAHQLAIGDKILSEEREVGLISHKEIVAHIDPGPAQKALSLAPAP